MKSAVYVYDCFDTGYRGSSLCGIDIVMDSFLCRATSRLRSQAAGFCTQWKCADVRSVAADEAKWSSIAH